MPHPDRCSEAIVGNAAGIAMFESCVEWVRGARPVLAIAR
jgi:phosphoribosylformylglycinamidine (FGAM) synthase-like amidotransferase family enzyme